jgi:circadian clock protein KaiB
MVCALRTGYDSSTAECVLDRSRLGSGRQSVAPTNHIRPARVEESNDTHEEASLSKYLLKLYVTGTSASTNVAIANLRRICEQDLKGRYELEIIDVLEFPQIAEAEKILATPTLIKELPLPLRRMIGDLSDRDKVLLGLDVRPPLNTKNREEDGS